ncbi:hypothetical protein [Ammoniphilus sp. CFH 90114]|uniref:hypothetical protein n=1 Tax=Ammoniphilus sp. CFH 90114 TaxID=2493665 RepID=UPI00100EFD95|nr:hypothetical protein [Ammoniphilus sp. CFH 90114]RXT08065.1 hypothetical protein EIZ39_11685 [Ammoniphilus sp. CFH 90114]
MDIDEKLQFMLEQQVFGAVELSDEHQFMGTLSEMDKGQLTFLDHSPNETNPLITVSIEDIVAVHIPEPTDCTMNQA